MTRLPWNSHHSSSRIWQTVDTIREGEYAGGLSFSYEMRPEARWENGDPVTAHDYLFTLKAVMNPKVAAASWRGFLAFIKHVEIDQDNERKFKVIVPEPYILAEVVTCNFNILPRHIFDPDGYLDDIDYRDLVDQEKAAELAEVDSNLIRFAEEFAQPKYNRDLIKGSGPYRLVEWVTGEHIIIEKKADWWGDKVDGAPAMMNGNPSRLTYRFIPDETAAISALKDGSVDIVAGVTATNFVAMRDDEEWNDKLAFHSPSLMQYNYIEINNRHPILSDREVRKALATAVDYESIISTLLLGMAERTSGPYHSSKDYYNDAIDLDEYDIEEARAILEDAGWTDTNQDGTVDKVIDGERTELNLDIIVTQRAEGQQLALMVKESAARAGIEIDIVTKDGSGLMQAIRSRDFELLPLRTRKSPSLDDPYQVWHSDSDQPGGGNRSGFTNERADEIIEEIRTTTDAEERNNLYKELQEVIYDDKPVIFLYVPTERIIVNQRIDMQSSSRRPGYFENLFSLSGT